VSVLIPDLPEEETAAAIERMSGYIRTVAGEISEVLTDSPWGRRRLAYTMRFNGQDYRDGYYVVTHFTAQPAAVAEIERELKLDTGVIRYLLVMDDPKAGEQVDEQAEAPAAAEAEDAKQPEGATERTPAEATEAPVADSANQAADQAPAEAGEAPATEAAQNEPSEAVAAAAAALPNEENPAPANGTTETQED